MNNASLFSYTFDESVEKVAISVYGTNGSETTNVVYWNVYCSKQAASTTASKVDTTYYQNLTTSMEGDSDFQDVVAASFSPYVNLLGSIAYLFFYGLFYLYSWNRSKTIVIPTVLLLLIGQATLGYMPQDYVSIIILFAGIGVMSVFYVMFGKDGR